MRLSILLFILCVFWGCSKQNEYVYSDDVIYSIRMQGKSLKFKREKDNDIYVMIPSLSSTDDTEFDIMFQPKDSWGEGIIINHNKVSGKLQNFPVFIPKEYWLRHILPIEGFHKQLSRQQIETAYRISK